MFLSKPVFPIAFSREDLEELLKSLVAEREWHHHKVASASLLFEPYYLFTYHAYSEEAEEGGAPAVGDIQQGRLALHAVSGEIDDALSEALSGEKPEPLQEAPAEEYVITRPELSVAEVNRLAPLKVASMLHLPKKNVEVSSLSLAYVPFWVASATLPSGEGFEVSVNAVTGELTDEPDIPERPKTYMDLFWEMLSDLRHPRAWGAYSKGVAGSVTGAGPLRSAGHAILYNRVVTVAVIVALIVLVSVLYLA